MKHVKRATLGARVPPTTPLDYRTLRNKNVAVALEYHPNIPARNFKKVAPTSVLGLTVKSRKFIS